MFSQTFVADPEHDHFIGPEVPKGEAWELNTLWMRAGQAGMAEGMLGIVRGDRFVALESKVNVMRGESLSWSGSVLLQEGDAPLYLTRGAKQDEEIVCSATWRVLSVSGPPKGKTTRRATGGNSKSAPKSDTKS